MFARLKRRLAGIRFPFKRVVIGFAFVSVIFLFWRLLELGKSNHLTPRVFWDAVIGNTSLVKQRQGRTNILLLGIGGSGHEGGSLTDTILIASIDLVNSDILLVSIPRDIWVPSIKDKLNAVYEQGEDKQPGSGLLLTKAAVEEVAGLPVHYASLIDFQGFKEMIDIVGGIDVNIIETFTDPLYPIAGKELDPCNGDPKFSCRYEKITFNAGMEHMDGERALKYVRSRHAEGDAGTDFSRGRRQQAVIVALKNKLAQKEVLTNVSLLQSFLKKVRQTTVTDISLGEGLLIARHFLTRSPDIRSIGITQEEPEENIPGLLINPPQWQYDGKWVLIPKHEDYSNIGNYIHCVIAKTVQCEDFLK